MTDSNTAQQGPEPDEEVGFISHAYLRHIFESPLSDEDLKAEAQRILASAAAEGRDPPAVLASG